MFTATNRVTMSLKIVTRTHLFHVPLGLIIFEMLHVIFLSNLARRFSVWEQSTLAFRTFIQLLVKGNAPADYQLDIFPVLVVNNDFWSQLAFREDFAIKNM